MSSRRDKVRLSKIEVEQFLAVARVASVATNGPGGWPHVAALWYTVWEGNLWIWTYAKSQKVRNLERDSKATVLIEDGTAYNELRGVMMRTDAKIHRDFERVLAVGEEILKRYVLNAGPVDQAAYEQLRAQSTKRVAVELVVQDIVSWDHSKL